LIIIDSDVLIEILDRKSLKGDQALKQITESKEEVATTTISLHEVIRITQIRQTNQRVAIAPNSKLHKKRRGARKQN